MVRWRGWVVLGTGLLACGSGGARGEQPVTQGNMTATGDASADDSAQTGAASASSEDGLQDKLDVGGEPPRAGCAFIDLLFVIDNSESMRTYQQALAAQFPDFVRAMYEALPAGLDVHVGITTTDFDWACDAAEATQNCQSTASYEEVQTHYLPPTESDNGGNGSQGRLFDWAGQRYFSTSTDDDPAALEAWFGDAAVAAGEEGCSFEMPVAAAGFATHPANAATNEGFVRDEGALLVVFFLTDEPDKSLESKDVYRQMVLDAKAECGGDACIFMSGLIPACTLDVNQKLWQFMGAFGNEPPWRDILDTANYSQLIGEALAGAVAQACADVPVP